MTGAALPAPGKTRTRWQFRRSAGSQAFGRRPVTHRVDGQVTGPQLHFRADAPAGAAEIQI